MTQPFILQWIVVSVVTAAAVTAWADPTAEAPAVEEAVEVLPYSSKASRVRIV